MERKRKKTKASGGEAGGSLSAAQQEQQLLQQRQSLYNTFEGGKKAAEKAGAPTFPFPQARVLDGAGGMTVVGKVTIAGEGGGGAHVQAKPRIRHPHLVPPRPKCKDFATWLSGAKKEWKEIRKVIKIAKHKRPNGAGDGNLLTGTESDADLVGGGRGGQDENKRPPSYTQLQHDVKRLKAENLALAQYIVASRAKHGVGFPD
jgi:hypothetical protein